MALRLCRLYPSALGHVFLEGRCLACKVVTGTAAVCVADTNAKRRLVREAYVGNRRERAGRVL